MSPDTSADHRPQVDVTVVMPSMNRSDTIARALQSIAVQTQRPRAVIVVDDASTDDTVSIAQRHGAQVIALDVNGGSGPARNRGITEADSRWIAFLDSDDAWLPDHLETSMNAMGSHVVVGAPGRSDRGRIIGNSTGRDQVVSQRSALIPGDVLCTSGVVASRDALLKAGLFRPLRRAQDLDMWIRTLDYGSGLALGQPGFTYHLHEGQAILDEDLMKECFGQIVEWCRDRPWFEDEDVDRAWVRWHWDDLRSAQRSGSYATLAAELTWIGRRPHTWHTLLDKLVERRRSRGPDLLPVR